MTERCTSGYCQVAGTPVDPPPVVTTTGGPITYMYIRTPPDCQIVVTPEGLARECVAPDLRTISYERVRNAPKLQDRAAIDRCLVEAAGFTLAWERPL